MKLPSFTLKPLLETRWESRIEAIKSFIKDLSKVDEALSGILEDENNDFDLSTKHQAASLLNKLRSYEFICSVNLWFDILTNVKIVSKLLQSTQMNIYSLPKL